MPSLTLKNVPDELYDRLKESAKLHRRSLNSEMLICLERTLMPTRMTPEEIIAEARAVRPVLRGPALTPEEIQAAIDEGRP